MQAPLPQIRPNQLEAWRSASVAQNPGQRAVLLDVREPWERQVSSVHPAGFERIDIAMNDIPQRLAELDPAQPIACLCHHGTRSQRVALFLAQNGFAQVANVAGGIDAWSREHDAAVPLY
ncbi:MAG: rhodanese-like domain-containing protein [Burkholderiales bacterium]